MKSSLTPLAWLLLALLLLAMLYNGFCIRPVHAPEVSPDAVGERGAGR